MAYSTEGANPSDYSIIRWNNRLKKKINNDSPIQDSLLFTLPGNHLLSPVSGICKPHINQAMLPYQSSPLTGYRISILLLDLCQAAFPPTAPSACARVWHVSTVINFKPPHVFVIHSSAFLWFISHVLPLICCVCCCVGLKGSFLLFASPSSSRAALQRGRHPSLSSSMPYTNTTLERWETLAIQRRQFGCWSANESEGMNSNCFSQLIQSCCHWPTLFTVAPFNSNQQ